PKPIPAYGATGYDGAEGSARVAAQWAERGFKGVKAKIGYPSVREDIEVVRAIRRAVGDDVALMVDYNQSLAPTDAIARAQRLEYAEWFNPIIAKPLSIKDGCATPNERPGSGIEWDDAAVKRYLVE